MKIHHDNKRGTFKVEQVNDIPDHLKARGSKGGAWNWLHTAIGELSPDGGALRIECPNKAEMLRAQASAQHTGRYGYIPENCKVVTRSEPVASNNGVYHLYIKVCREE